MGITLISTRTNTPISTRTNIPTSTRTKTNILSTRSQINTLSSTSNRMITHTNRNRSATARNKNHGVTNKNNNSNSTSLNRNSTSLRAPSTMPRPEITSASVLRKLLTLSPMVPSNTLSTLRTVPRFQLSVIPQGAPTAAPAPVPPLDNTRTSLPKESG